MPFPDYMPEHSNPVDRVRRKHILDQNARMRIELPQRDLGQDGEGGTWGAWALQIPELDWAILQVRYPDLIAKDREIQSKAMNKFILSDESLPYRVR